MILAGIARLGRDAEVRYTPSGDPVASLSLAFNYGQKDGEGKRPTQWVDAALWGKRAESLKDYLTKGKEFFVVLSDPHIETYEKRDNGGTGFKLVARVDQIEFTSAPREAGDAPRDRAPAGKAPPGNFNDFEDDIPL